MKFRKVVAPVGVAAVAIGMATATAVPASAINNIKPFGQQETINDLATGGPLIGYTVTGLSPSSDAVPHNGQLYEAPVTVDAFGVWATPVIPMFNARAESGQTTASSAGAFPQRLQAARRPASSTSTSWATCPTALCTTTAARICWRGSRRAHG